MIFTAPPFKFRDSATQRLWDRFFAKDEPEVAMQHKLIAKYSTGFNDNDKATVALHFEYVGSVAGSVILTGVDARTVTDWHAGDVFEFKAPVKVQPPEEPDQEDGL